MFLQGILGLCFLFRNKDKWLHVKLFYVLCKLYIIRLIRHYRSDPEINRKLFLRIMIRLCLRFIPYFSKWFYWIPSPWVVLKFVGLATKSCLSQLVPEFVKNSPIWQPCLQIWHPSFSSLENAFIGYLVQYGNPA